MTTFVASILIKPQDKRKSATGKAKQRDREAANGNPKRNRAHPMLPSRLIPSSFCASTANTIGSCCSTSFAKPLTISDTAARSEEHTSELQSLLRNSYAVFCLKKKQHTVPHTQQHT